MSKVKSRIGKAGFLISLIPIASIIVVFLLELSSETLEKSFWPFVTIFGIFGLSALILSISSLKLSGRSAWAISGTVISGLELLYLIVGLVHDVLSA